MNRFWNINATEDAATLNLYGTIGDDDDWRDSYGVTPRAFASELSALGNKPLDVRVNSGGGSVFAALTIRNLLMDYKGAVTITIDGLAASAATLITCAGHCRMPRGAMMMIHDPTVGLEGNYGADELRKATTSLDAVKGSIIEVYRQKTGLSDAEIIRMMVAETWLSADEALRLRFVDAVIESEVKLEMSGTTKDALIFSLLKRADNERDRKEKEISALNEKFDALTRENAQLREDNSKLRAEMGAREEVYAMIRSQMNSGASAVKPSMEIDKRSAAIAEVVRFANQRSKPPHA